MNIQPYEYAVLKYVHDPVAGECLNVGVVLISPQQEVFFDGRFEQKYSRLSGVFSHFNGEYFRQFVSRVHRQVEQIAKEINGAPLLGASSILLEQHLKELLPDSGMSFRFSEVRAGITENPAEELSHLFFRYVTSQYEKEISTHRDDEAVWNTFRTPLKAHNVLSRLQEKTFAKDDFEHTFNRAFKNGKWHVLESVTFDYVRAEQLTEKATRYIGLATALQNNPEMGKLYLLLGRPVHESNIKHYERAKRLLSKHLPVEHVLVEESDAVELAVSVAKFMEEHPPE